MDAHAAGASVDAARLRLDLTKRRHWRVRRSRRDDLARAVARRDRCASKVRDSDADDVAFALVEQLWNGHASKLRAKTNPWHPRLEPHRRQLSGKIAQEALAQTVRGSGREAKAGDIPALAALLTEPAVRTMLDEHAAKINAVAADPRVETANRFDSDGQSVYVVEHPASGIRARFHLPNPGSVIGSVYSKPYDIAPVDTSHHADWERYAGLGVGTRIYRYAADRFPAVRWSVQMTSEYSSAVRRRLHNLDPYRWQSQSCDWCRHHGLADRQQWEAASEADYEEHPR